MTNEAKEAKVLTPEELAEFRKYLADDSDEGDCVICHTPMTTATGSDETGVCDACSQSLRVDMFPRLLSHAEALSAQLAEAKDNAAELLKLCESRWFENATLRSEVKRLRTALQQIAKLPWHLDNACPSKYAIRIARRCTRW